MKILIIGSGHYYGKWFGRGGNYCMPRNIVEEYTNIVTNANNTITYIDNNPNINPDKVIDILENNWWDKLSDRYDIIIDTISHIGPHINGQKKYKDIFKVGCKSLLNTNGIFYGFAEL